MFYVYLIRSVNFPDRKYIGHTDNLQERLETHNSGGSLYTKQHRPWKLAMFFAFDDKLKAAAFEKYFKVWRRPRICQKALLVIYHSNSYEFLFLSKFIYHANLIHKFRFILGLSGFLFQ
jgi:putative endonuclease